METVFWIAAALAVFAAFVAGFLLGCYYTRQRLRHQPLKRFTLRRMRGIPKAETEWERFLTLLQR